jgi:hypothetical protein
VELWRRLAGPQVTLAAGLEILLRPYHAYRPIQYNSRETARGAAAAMFARGADRLYLFNYMDRSPAMMSDADYAALLKECGSLKALAGKPRRFVVTYADTWAPGEAEASQLPKTLDAGGWAAFRLQVGPRLDSARLRMQLDGCEVAEVRVNGIVCQPAGHDDGLKPGPERGLDAWQVPGAVEGACVVHVQARRPGRIQWVELAGV